MILRRIAEGVRNQDWFTVVVEVLIVVVGIFLGLQVDDWNEARKERALEHEYLARLAGDIRVDIDEFLKLQGIFETKAKMIADLQELPVAEILSRPEDQLALELDYTTWKALPEIQSATMTELTSAGRLTLLRDSPLRTALSSYYSEYELLSGILSESDGNYRVMFFGAIPGDIYFDMRLSNQLDDLDRLGTALTALQSDPDFEATANIEIAYAASLIFYLRLFRDRADSLLDQIEPLLLKKEADQ